MILINGQPASPNIMIVVVQALSVKLTVKA